MAKKKVSEEEEEEKLKRAMPRKVVPKKSVKTNVRKTVAKKTAPKKVKVDDKLVVKLNESSINEKINVVCSTKISDRIGPAKTKRFSDDKYVRLSENSSVEKFKEMSDKVQDGSLQWAYYALDGDIGYHYYIILN